MECPQLTSVESDPLDVVRAFVYTHIEVVVPDPKNLHPGAGTVGVGVGDQCPQGSVRQLLRDVVGKLYGGHTRKGGPAPRPLYYSPVPVFASASQKRAMAWITAP